MNLDWSSFEILLEQSLTLGNDKSQSNQTLINANPALIDQSLYSLF